MSKKISLHPLRFKEALGDLLKVKPEAKDKKASEERQRKKKRK